MSRKEIERGLGIRKDKYHRVAPEQRTWLGIVFDSRKEMIRYQELVAAEKAGIIHKLERQVAWPLYALRFNKADKSPIKPVGNYIADFTYIDDQERTIVEDVKGMITPLARWKLKHFQLQYGLTVLLT